MLLSMTEGIYIYIYIYIYKPTVTLKMLHLIVIEINLIYYWNWDVIGSIIVLAYCIDSGLITKVIFTTHENGVNKCMSITIYKY